MKFLRKYKTIYFQIIGLAIIYFRFHAIFLLFIAVTLAFLPILLPKIGIKYVSFFEKLLHHLGNLIKSVLFAFIFGLIIIPLSLLKKIISKDDTKNFLSNSKIESTDFKKMW